MSEFFTILTAVGKAKIAEALAEGRQIRLRNMIVGDGGGQYAEPNERQTAVVHEVWRGPLNTLKIAPENTAWVIAEAVLAEAVGGWYVREVGLEDDEGDLIAIGKFPETYKPKLPAGASKQIVIRAVMEVTNAAAVTLMVDPSLVMATVEYVDSSIEEHERSHNHPDATLTQKGFTQLNSSTNSTLETQAATPKAVKAAMDKATEALEKAGTSTAHKHAWGDITGVPDGTTAQKGIVKLNSATNSTSTTEAATPSAVKAAYDLANGKAAGSHKHVWGDITGVPDGTTAQKGIVKLNSSTNSTSTTEAATPSAVKAAYDKASATISSQDADVRYFANFALFTANGTFTVPAGVKKVMFEMIGGGAGGGTNRPGVHGYSPPSGGCAGVYFTGVTTVTPGNKMPVTVGGGGLGAVPGSNSSSSEQDAGSSGGTSSFAGSTASGGLCGYECGVWDPAQYNVSAGSEWVGGDGENSPFGSGGKGVVAGSSDATGFGAGGSGGGSKAVAPGARVYGGNGSPGFVRIWW